MGKNHPIIDRDEILFRLGELEILLDELEKKLAATVNEKAEEMIGKQRKRLNQAENKITKLSMEAKAKKQIPDMKPLAVL